MTTKKIFIASDHAGFEKKEIVKKALIQEGFDMVDVGTFDKTSCDYPNFAFRCAEEVIKNKSFGILICSSGEGIMIAANKVKGIRAGVGYNDDVAALLREHNDANMIAFGASFMREEDIINRSIIFLTTSCLEGRHRRRVDLIETYENEHMK